MSCSSYDLCKLSCSRVQSAIAILKKAGWKKSKELDETARDEHNNMILKVIKVLQSN